MGVSKTNKTYASRYKTDCSVTQTSNTGFDATTRVICSGDGADSSLSLSDDVLSVQPVNDDTVATMICKDQSGSNILAVDTTNKKVLCGSSQVNALTSYVYFNAYLLHCVADTHVMIPFQMSQGAATTDTLIEHNLADGDNPATTFDVSSSSNSNEVVNHYWYVPDAITITGVHILVGGDAASAANDLNFHIMKYNLDTSSNLGDLSSGVVVADQAAVISDVHEDAVKYKSLTVDTSNNNVTSGQVVICTVESTGTDEISCVVTVKYNIQ